MQKLITPHVPKVEPFAWWGNAFTTEELDKLQAKAKEGVEDAYVGGGTEDLALRRTRLNWLTNDKEYNWVFNILASVVSNLNADYYSFDLTGFGEPLQLGNYTAEDQGSYGWHQDFGKGPSRKLTLVLQLTDPAEYEGGNLEIFIAREPERLRKERGLITMFPCWTMHRVTPVVQGARQTLVAWVSGSPFK